jgi:hypothetical protein
VIAAAWMPATLLLMFLARIAGWLTLGRWPQPSADDPKSIGLAVDVFHTLGLIGALLSNLALGVSAFIVVRAMVRRRWRAASIALAIGVAGWLVALVLGNVDDTVEWFMD